MTSEPRRITVPNAVRRQSFVDAAQPAKALERLIARELVREQAQRHLVELLVRAAIHRDEFEQVCHQRSDLVHERASLYCL